MQGRARSVIVSGLISVALAFSTTPVVAVAETSDQIRTQLTQAQQTLSGLYQEAEMVSEGLNEVRVRLDETNASINQLNAEIEQTKADLSKAREDLSLTMSWSYKAHTSFLSLILSSQGIEELVSNIYYANKISASQADKVGRVNELKRQQDEQVAELEQTKAQQEELLAQQEERQAQLNAAAAEAEGYVSTLSAELQEALAAEEAARQEAARRAAEEAAARAAEEAARIDAERRAREAEAAQQATPSADVPSASTASVGGDVASIVVSTAYSELGCPYVWGAEGPSTFDCSGLVMYCYAAAGISVPHYSGDLAAYCNKSAQAAVAGDIVWRSGHVGLCIGNGQVIEALPGSGVTFGTVDDFVTSGSPV